MLANFFQKFKTASIYWLSYKQKQDKKPYKVNSDLCVIFYEESQRR